jgi:hypothetical protein
MKTRGRVEAQRSFSEQKVYCPESKDYLALSGGDRGRKAASRIRGAALSHCFRGHLKPITASGAVIITSRHFTPHYEKIKT